MNADKRTMNPTGGSKRRGKIDRTAFQQHDPKRRLGNFGGTGEAHISTQ